MAAPNLTSAPTVTSVVEQRYLIEPLQGAKGPVSYLHRFPDELYSKAPESHLVRFMYALLGPSGVGQLHNNYLRARLALEDHGLEFLDLELFYGSPFRFGRVLSETYASDPSGMLTQAEWDLILARDAKYRSRAIDFFNGVRAGNTPVGMRLVARSGLGHDVQIVENYKALFDRWSDDPIGVPYFGQTDSTAEMVVVPRHEASVSASQQITVTGASGGNLQLGFRGALTNGISWPTFPSGLAVAAVGSGGTFAAGTYYWTVTAVDSTGETIASNEVSIAIVLNGSANLSWTAVPGATSYRVYRGTASANENVLVGSPAGTTFTDTGTAGTSQSPPTSNASSSALNGSAAAVQTALEALSTIGKGNVKVTGGPTLVVTPAATTAIVNPYVVLFTGALAAQPMPLLTSINNLTGATPTISIVTTTTGVDAADETAAIAVTDRRSLQGALDRLRPVGTLPTFSLGTGTRRRQTWAAAAASSESIEVLRYVSGQAGVPWPTVYPYQWIQKNVEKEAPRPQESRRRQYHNLHNIIQCLVSSIHIGRFSDVQVAAFPFLGDAHDDKDVFLGVRAIADYPEPLSVTSSFTYLGKVISLLAHMYPAEYLSLPGVPEIKRTDHNYWSSQEAASGSETLILDLGTAQALNYLSFEITRKPVGLLIEYDSLDNGDGTYAWHGVTPVPNQPYPDSFGYSSTEQNPWIYAPLHFTDAVGQQIFSRYIRLTFSRRTTDPINSFLNGAPFSVEVRNLRVGRTVV